MEFTFTNIETEGIANTAAGAVKITYSDVKPPILSLQDAIRKKSFFPKPAKDVVVGDAESKYVMYVWYVCYVCVMTTLGFQPFWS